MITKKVLGRVVVRMRFVGRGTVGMRWWAA